MKKKKLASLALALPLTFSILASQAPANVVQACDVHNPSPVVTDPSTNVSTPITGITRTVNVPVDAVNQQIYLDGTKVMAVKFTKKIQKVYFNFGQNNTLNYQFKESTIAFQAKNDYTQEYIDVTFTDGTQQKIRLEGVKDLDTLVSINPIDNYTFDYGKKDGFLGIKGMFSTGSSNMKMSGDISPAATFSYDEKVISITRNMGGWTITPLKNGKTKVTVKVGKQTTSFTVISDILKYELSAPAGVVAGHMSELNLFEVNQLTKEKTDVSSKASWSVSNSSLAKIIKEDGKVYLQGVNKKGTVDIRVKYEGKTLQTRCVINTSA